MKNKTYCKHGHLQVTKNLTTDGRCKLCRHETGNRWAKQNRKRINDIKRNYHKTHPGSLRNEKLKQLYGINIVTWEEVFRAQGKCCAICKIKKARWDTDHNHKTNKFRGILCHSCNVVLGFSKDSIPLLKAAIKYLQRDI